jgi:hypothetical protein
MKLNVLLLVTLVAPTRALLLAGSSSPIRLKVASSRIVYEGESTMWLPDPDFDDTYVPEETARFQLVRVQLTRVPLVVGGVALRVKQLMVADVCTMIFVEQHGFQLLPLEGESRRVVSSPRRETARSGANSLKRARKR